MLKVAARSVVSKTSVPVKAAAQVVRTAAARLERQLARQTSKGLERALAVVNALRVPPQGSRQHYVRIEGALADVMLPASGGCEVDSFRRWAKALEHVDAFGDQRKQVHALTEVNVSRGEGACDDRPRIGIMVHEAKELLDPEKRDLKSLVAAVERLGARPVFIPPLADLALGDDPLMREQVASGIIRQLDGLIGPGGWDIHPRIYRAPFDGSSKEGMVFVRDRFEAELVQTARESNLFTLGICRTMQLTNAIGEGGVLGQDLLSLGKVARSHVMMKYGLDKAEVMRWPEEEGGGEHLVHARGELAEIFGKPEMPTNSIHHQWVQKASEDLEVVGWVHDDETGEDVIEATRRWNMMLVQFHPEYRPDSVEGKALLGLLGRSWAFYFADQLKQGGVQPTVERLTQKLEAAGVELSDADRQWLNEELAPRL